MKNRGATGNWISALILGAAFMLFSAGCSKHGDDCATPKSGEDASMTTRSASTSTNVLTDGGKGAGLSARSLDVLDGQGSGDEGISDDGDDETDGERSNKRPKN